MTGAMMGRLAGLALAGAGLALAACAGTPSDVGSALAARPSDVASSAAVDFTSLREGWKPTGLTVEEGRYLTVFGRGAVMPGPDALQAQPQAPRQFLWVRIGGAGPVIGLGADEDTFRAPRSGAIEIAVKPTGIYFDDPSGALPGGAQAQPDQGVDVGAVIAVWRDDPAAGLAALSRDPEDAFARAGAALANAAELPAGFEPHWNVGRSDAFAAWSDGTRTGIRLLPTRGGGIVLKPVDIPLTEDTELSFTWVYDHVPALGPESEFAFHDYMSIALEFDNGQDLTWMRSAHLDAEQSFHCPLPWWDTRETHFVIEDADDPLGQWRSHTRSVAADYEAAVDAPMPSRITGVWFINVGVFGGYDGDSRFADVAITSGGTRTEIFEPG